LRPSELATWRLVVMTTRIPNPPSSSTPPGVLSRWQPGRYDYSKVSVIRLRASQQQKRRELAANGSWIVGRFVLTAGIIHIEAVRLQPGWWIDDAAPLTASLDQFARWRTRQGARQWLLRHARPACHLINLDRLADDSEGGGLVVSPTTGP